MSRTQQRKTMTRHRLRPGHSATFGPRPPRPAPRHWALAVERHGRCNGTRRARPWRCGAATWPAAEPGPSSGPGSACTSRAAASVRTGCGWRRRWPAARLVSLVGLASTPVASTAVSVGKAKWGTRDDVNADNDTTSHHAFRASATRSLQPTPSSTTTTALL